MVVPACGNLGLAGRQLWLGRRHAGKQVQLWIDHRVIHLSTDGVLLKTVASRFTTAEVAGCASSAPTRPAHHQPAPRLATTPAMPWKWIGWSMRPG